MLIFLSPAYHHIWQRCPICWTLLLPLGFSPCYSIRQCLREAAVPASLTSSPQYLPGFLQLVFIHLVAQVVHSSWPNKYVSRVVFAHPAPSPQRVGTCAEELDRIGEQIRTATGPLLDNLSVAAFARKVRHTTEHW